MSTSKIRWALFCDNDDYDEDDGCDEYEYEYDDDDDDSSDDDSSDDGWNVVVDDDDSYDDEDNINNNNNNNDLQIVCLSMEKQFLWTHVVWDMSILWSNYLIKELMLISQIK